MSDRIDSVSVHTKSAAPAAERKLERVLGWSVVLLLLAGCLLVLRPFVSALLWAVVLCFATWPIFQRLLRLSGNRRSVAAFIIAFAMILIVVGPVILVGTTLAEN